MNLVWHIAKKDIRRMAWPVAAWLVFSAGFTIWFSVSTPLTGDELASGNMVWLTLLRIWCTLLQVVQAVLVSVIVAALMLEDPVVGSAAWWSTRPIASGRLFAGKVVAILTLLVAAPVAILLVIWVAGGFAVSDALRLAVGAARIQITLVLPAMMVASLVKNLVQFLFCAIGVALAYFACDVGAQLLMARPLVAVEILQARQFIVVSAPFVIAAVVATHQYLTRNSVRSWAIVVATLLVVGFVRLAWPWPQPRESSQDAAKPMPAEQAAQIHVSPTLVSFSDKANEQPWARITMPWSKPSFLVPEDARESDGRAILKASPGQFQNAARRVLGFDHSTEPLPWQMMVTGWPNRLPMDALFQFSGELVFALVEPQVLGEVALEEGRNLVAGSSRTTILGLGRTGDQLDAIYVAERDPATRSDLNLDFYHVFHGTPGQYDAYVLVDRARNRANSLWGSPVGAVEFNGIRLVGRRLSVAGGDSWRGASLVKVRFTRIDRFSEPVAIKGVAVEGDHR